MFLCCMCMHCIIMVNVYVVMVVKGAIALSTKYNTCTELAAFDISAGYA